MALEETLVKQATKYLFPWVDGAAETGGLLKVPVNAAREAAFQAALRVVPHISDEKLVSLFSHHLEQIPYEEGREFVSRFPVLIKRMLASSKYRDAAAKVIKRISSQQYSICEKRQAFLDKNGFDAPGFLAISPSMRCNLRCVGCYAGEYNMKDDLSPDLVDRTVSQARDMGIALIVVIGGEPFISDDVLRMLESNPDISFLVYTNGTLIDESLAKRLARAGNVYPAISLEGYEAETDLRRGKGTYAKILKAMENLRQAGVPFGFSATVVRSNSELVSSPEFVDFYIGKGALMGWYFNYIPIGREPDVDLMPTPEQRIARWRRIREVRRSRPIMLADFWCDGAITGGCLAGGRFYLHINNKGDVEPCVFAHFAVDNIKQKSLEEILGSPFFRKIRSRQPFSENLLRPCMITDNPEILREAVAEGGAVPTHQGAEGIIGRLAPQMDRYSRQYAETADREWQKERAGQSYEATVQTGGPR